MRRAIVTSGGYGNPRSKFKPLKKVVTTNHYINVGGELLISSKCAILREKDIVTGSYTGKKYKIGIKSVQSKLPIKYRNVKSLEIICTLRIRKKKMGKKEEYSYSCQIAHIHHTLSNEEVINTVAEPLNASTQTKSEIDSSQELPKNFDKTVFKYIGNKDEVERQVANELHSVIGGVREFYTPDSERIDLLTSNLLIEVKAASDWDNAIGQVLKYKIHFPRHKPVIFIFDDGLSFQTAKTRLLQIIESFITIDINVVTSIKELQRLLD